MFINPEEKKKERDWYFAYLSYILGIMSSKYFHFIFWFCVYNDGMDMHGNISCANIAQYPKTDVIKRYLVFSIALTKTNSSSGAEAGRRLDSWLLQSSQSVHSRHCAVDTFISLMLLLVLCSDCSWWAVYILSGSFCISVCMGEYDMHYPLVCH